MTRRLLQGVTLIVLLPALGTWRRPAPGQAPAAPKAVRLAVIGDYGVGGAAEAEVAALVASWSPDFIITTGDNNYSQGSAATIDQNIGQYYHSYIYPYAGGYGDGATANRFFPAMGNHDWFTYTLPSNPPPYLGYFQLPGNERYYSFAWGPLELFCLDSDGHEPDGYGVNSSQAHWLQAALAGSTAPWKLVYMHHPPYSSGPHGSTSALQWPYAAWGASAVLAGHDHDYERIERDGLPYFVDGAGGAGLYDFNPQAIVAGSQVRYNAEHGAMLIEASAGLVVFRFITAGGQLVDIRALFADPPRAFLPLVGR